MVLVKNIVISKKIQYDNCALKSKSFAISFGIHITLFTIIAVFINTNHSLPKSDTRITLSLSEFLTTSSDIQHNEVVSKPKEYIQNTISSEAKPHHSITTSQKTPSLTPSVSPEASAPLVHNSMPASTPSLPNVQNDSPHLTSTPPEHELPKNTVPDNQIGGAALGHIRTMIENAIIYPSIARKLHLEGVALVTFTLKPDGTVDTAYIKHTSGSALLDTKAIQTILSLSGFYPALGKTFELSVPIAFKLS